MAGFKMKDDQQRELIQQLLKAEIPERPAGENFFALGIINHDSVDLLWNESVFFIGAWRTVVLLFLDFMAHNRDSLGKISIGLFQGDEARSRIDEAENQQRKYLQQTGSVSLN
jgi:hypothetical protein